MGALLMQSDGVSCRRNGREAPTGTLTNELLDSDPFSLTSDVIFFTKQINYFFPADLAIPAINQFSNPLFRFLDCYDLSSSGFVTCFVRRVIFP